MVMAQRSDGKPTPTQAVDRALRLLAAVAFEPGLETVKDLADHCGLNRSTAHRLLSTLERHGLVERHPTTQGYQVGYGAISIANAAPGYDALVRRAMPEMERLRDAINDTVTLMAVSSMRLYAAAAVYPNHMMRPTNVTGRLLPLHATAMGKMLLAGLDEDSLGFVLSQPLAAYTSATHTREQLLGELPRIRERGYSISIGEFEDGLNAVAAPITDRSGRVVAGVTVVGPSYRLTPDRLGGIGERAIESARSITRSLEQTTV